eukprot:CAMPEP_0172459382 /NCGR_PEP_ID=MMETSP1065-20121228/32463_1 /TAXON_ID=265537 /ORGANISM="Amphiprora paludosa, Strain CCMP125" /LENGTH=240 /DNA_ID=CAMNT_0013214051 /DNA_START=246 /DNA_END=966 /DNA_ORIENTATION=-
MARQVLRATQSPNCCPTDVTGFALHCNGLFDRGQEFKTFLQTLPNMTISNLKVSSREALQVPWRQEQGKQILDGLFQNTSLLEIQAVLVYPLYSIYSEFGPILQNIFFRNRDIRHVNIMLESHKQKHKIPTAIWPHALAKVSEGKAFGGTPAFLIVKSQIVEHWLPRIENRLGVRKRSATSSDEHKSGDLPTRGKKIMKDPFSFFLELRETTFVLKMTMLRTSTLLLHKVKILYEIIENL